MMQLTKTVSKIVAETHPIALTPRKNHAGQRFWPNYLHVS